MVAIIAILAAILFPVFARAREKAYQSSCQSNQRQLAIALLAATQDNDETLPLPSEWVTATNMSTDAKIFNCLSNSRRGIPSDPDYGMNAFLFDVDPDSGAIVGLALGQIENPSGIELTCDKKAGLTPQSTGIALKDEAMNPFPSSFTITGFNSMGEMRHSEGLVVSYLDGHVRLLKDFDLGSGVTGYNIPPNWGRCFVDFSQCKDQTDADTRLHVGFTGNGVGGYSASNYGTFNADGTYTLSAGDALVTSGTWGEAADPTMWLPFGSSFATFYMEATASSDACFTFGTRHVAGSWPFPTADPENQNVTFGKAFTIDKVNNRFQGGQMYAWSTVPYAGYTNVGQYTSLKAKAGKQTAIPAATTRFIIEVRSSYITSWFTPWPTEPDKNWLLPPTASYTSAFTTETVCENYADVTVTTPNSRLSYRGPFFMEEYAAQGYGRGVFVHTGSLKINKILVNTY
ncbi:MAG: hypothetical protein ACYDCO_15055 [Armatimonadota bacterium]